MEERGGKKRKKRTNDTSMTKTRKTVQKTFAMADILEADIREKQLKPGDPYLSTMDASRLLGVSGGTANRVLQILEKRRIIQRRQRVGAVVLETPVPEKHDIKRVHFLIHEKYFSSEGIGTDGILFGLQPVLASASVELFFLKQGQEEEQVKRLIDHSIAAGETDGFVLVRTPYEVQSLLAHSRLPAVVHGACYTGIETISNIDRDHTQVAGIVLNFMEKRGRVRPALLMRQTVLPGDMEFLDTLTSRPAPWIFRYIPTDDEIILAECRKLLARDGRPDLVVCQTRRHADMLRIALKETNLEANRDLDVLVLQYYFKARREETDSVEFFPHIISEHSPEKTGRRIGELLRAASRGEKPSHEIISVRLSADGIALIGDDSVDSGEESAFESSRSI